MSLEREIDNWPDELIGSHVGSNGRVNPQNTGPSFEHSVGEACYSYGGLAGFSGNIPAKRKNLTAVLGRNGKQP